MPLASVRPVKIRRDDPDLSTQRLRVVGYRAYAGDDPVGPVQETYALARADAWQHNHPHGWVLPPADLQPPTEEGTVSA